MSFDILEREKCKTVITDLLKVYPKFPYIDGSVMRRYGNFRIYMQFNDNGQPFAAITHQEDTKDSTRLLGQINIRFTIGDHRRVRIDSISVTPDCNLSGFNTLFNELNRQKVQIAWRKRLPWWKKIFLKND